MTSKVAAEGDIALKVNESCPLITEKKHDILLILLSQHRGVFDVICFPETTLGILLASALKKDEKTSHFCSVPNHHPSSASLSGSVSSQQETW